MGVVLTVGEVVAILAGVGNLIVSNAVNVGMHFAPPLGPSTSAVSKLNTDGMNPKWNGGTMMTRTRKFKDQDSIKGMSLDLHSHNETSGVGGTHWVDAPDKRGIMGGMKFYDLDTLQPKGLLVTHVPTDERKVNGTWILTEYDPNECAPGSDHCPFHRKRDLNPLVDSVKDTITHFGNLLIDGKVNLTITVTEMVQKSDSNFTEAADWIEACTTALLESSVVTGATPRTRTMFAPLTWFGKRKAPTTGKGGPSEVAEVLGSLIDTAVEASNSRYGVKEAAIESISRAAQIKMRSGPYSSDHIFELYEMIFGKVFTPCELGKTVCEEDPFAVVLTLRPRDGISEVLSIECSRMFCLN